MNRIADTRCRMLLSLALCTGSPPAIAAEVSELTGCRALQDPQERVACYDALVDEGSADKQAPELESPAPAAQSSVVSAAAATAVTTAPLAAVPDQDAETEFGATEPRESEKLEAIVQPIAAVGRTPLNALVVTLANGQVWKQVDGRTLPLKAGQEVEIRVGLGGSFYLSKTSGSRSLKVRRID